MNLQTKTKKVNTKTSNNHEDFNLSEHDKWRDIREPKINKGLNKKSYWQVVSKCVIL